MKERFSSRHVAFLGMMTALVFVSNYARIVIPVSIGGNTSFTLANIVCVLSGLLFGPAGGLASGLGSALYDLTFPAYASEAWLTFINKGLMGLAAGLAAYAGRRGHLDLPMKKGGYPRFLASAVVGCIVYYILYFAKNIWYNGMLVEGLTFQASLAILPLKVSASLFNSVIAIVAAPPLAVALLFALRRIHLLPERG